MGELTDLLERAVPPTGCEPDVHVIRARSRRLRRRRHLARGVVGLTVVALLVGVVRSWPSDERTIETATPPTGPVGTWSQAAPIPIPLEIFDVELHGLSDGRLVVLTPSRLPEQPGAIYDPASNTWSVIPSGPDLGEPAPEGALVVSLVWAGDALAVARNDVEGRVWAAVFDAAALTWAAAPVLEDIPGGPNAMGWTGETLVLVRTARGSEGPVLDDGVSRDWTVDEPSTHRWTLGDPVWSAGQAPPLDLGPRPFSPGGAGDTERVVAWEGDGAVYDIATDSWSLLPPSPLGAVASPMTRLRGDSIAVGAQDSSVVATLRISTGEWRVSAAAPGGTVSMYDGLFRSPILDEAADGDSPKWYLDETGQWAAAPFARVVTDSSRYLAVNDPVVQDPVGAPFEAQFLRGGEWVPAAPAPFADRGSPALLLDQDRLYVVGGRSAANLDGLDADPEVWVLDLSREVDDAAPFNVWMEPTALPDEIAAVRDVLAGSPIVSQYTYGDQTASFADFAEHFADQSEIVSAVEPHDLPTRFAVTVTGDASDLRAQLVALPGVVDVAAADGSSPLHTAPPG